MNAGLRADLHIHTREAEPFIRYSAREVIARAAREGYRVLSITNHDTLTFTKMEGQDENYVHVAGLVSQVKVSTTVAPSQFTFTSPDIGHWNGWQVL